MGKSLNEISDFIDKSPQRSIFCYPWWLKAVAPDKYEYIYTTKNNQIKSLMPIIKEDFLFTNYCTMPSYTQMLGVLLPKMQGKYTTQLSKEHKLMKKLIKKLPNCFYYNFRLHYSITNWLPFYWEGFEQKTRYTYILENIDDHENIWNSMRSNKRRAIRKAKDIVDIEESNNINDLIRLHKKTYNRKNKSLSKERLKTIEHIFKACREREQGKLLIARDSDNNIHSSQLFVWDDRMAYYLIGGNDPEYMSSGASSYVMWEGIKNVSDKVNKFNFEGSMDAGVERFFRGFGARQERFFSIQKYQPAWLKIKKWI